MKKLAPVLKLMSKAIIGALFIGVILGGGLSSQQAFAGNDTLYVGGFTSVTAQWTTVGSSPWLNNSTANYIYTKTDEYWHEEFLFDDSASTNNILNSVSLYIEMQGSSARNDTADLYIHDGTSWSLVLAQDVDADSYTWYNYDVSATLDTWTKVQNAKLKVQYQRSGSPSTVEIYIRRAYFYTTWSSPTTTLGDGSDPSNSTVAAGSTNNYVDQFTFQTSGGTDTVTQLVVTTANTTAIASVEIWDNTGPPSGTQYFATVSSPSGDTWTFSGGTTIPVSTSPTSFRVYFNAQTDANLTDGNYAVTGTVTSFTCGNTTGGTDTDSATITVDDQHPQINARATTSNATTVRVTYNEAVKHVSAANANDALNTNNYVISPSIAVSSVSHISGDTTFDLTTASQTTDTYYTIVISNVEDNVGNVIDAAEDETTFLGYQAGGGAVTLIQQKDARNAYGSPNSPTGWVQASLTDLAAEGNLLVTGVAIDKASGTITQPSGFTLIHKGEGGISSGAFAYKIATGGEQTIRWDWGASEEGNTWVGEYSGLVSSNVLDVSAENEGNLSIATNSISTGTTVATTQADELAVAMLISDSGNSVGSSRSWTNSFTSIFEEPVPEESGNPFLAVATKTLTSTGTVETTITWPTDGVWPDDEAYATVATFKAAAAAANEFVQRSFAFQNDNAFGVDNCTNIANADTNITSVKKGERMTIRLQVAAFVSSAVSKTFKLQFERTDIPGTWTDVGASTEISYSSGLTSSNGTNTASEVATACRDTWVNGTWHEGTGSTDGTVSLNDGNYTEFAFMIHTGNATLNTSYNVRLYNNTDSDTLIYHKTPQLTVVDSTNDIKRHSKGMRTQAEGLPTGITPLEYYFDDAGYNNVTSNDSDYESSISSSDLEYTVVNFAFKNTTYDPEDEDTHNIRVKWTGKEIGNATGTIFLQMYDFKTDTWVTKDSKTSPAINTDYELGQVITGTDAQTGYGYDDAGTYWTYWRVYQQSASTAQLESDSAGGDFGITAIDLAEFYAIGYDNKVVLKWKTAAEANNVGFNIYRSSNKSSGYTRINSSLIIGQGTSVMGHEYQFIDNNVTNGTTYYYILEDVDCDGSITRHGPVTAHPGLDSDGDGMSDDYEIHFGLNPHDPSDAALDPDGDGRTNLEEYQDGTDPTRPESVFLNAQEEVTVIDEGEDYLILELNTSILESKDIAIGGQTYQEVWLPEYIHSYTEVPGQPMLPEKGVLAGTKTFNKASIEVLDSEYDTYLNYNILPQSRYIQEEDPDTGIVWIKRQFYKDETAYSQNEFFPGALTEIDYSYYLREQKIINIRFYPLQYNPYADELKFYTKIRIRVDLSTVSESEPSFDIPDDLYKSGSIKLFIRDEGMYKLTKDYLEAQGIDTLLINPQSIRIFNQGEEVPIHVEGGGDGYLDSDDYIVFYAETTDSAYTNENLYWLALNETGEALYIEPEDSAEASNFLDLTSFSCYKHIELDEEYWMDVEGAANPWFFSGYLWAPCSVNYTFDIEDLLSSFEEAELTLSLYGLFDILGASGHHAYIYVNDYFIGEDYWEGDSERTFIIQIPAYYLLEGENVLTIELPGGLSQLFELALLDYIDVTYPKKFIAEDDHVIFSPNVEGAYEFTVEDFTTDEGIKIFKIKDDGAAKEIESFSVSPDGATYTATFRDIVELTDRYIILAESAYKTPASLLANTPSNLTSASNQADYIIITNEELAGTVAELADYRASQGLEVEIAKIQDVYDEFNYGMPGPEAVREFLSYAYTKWKKPAPKYVLLAGDATLDPKDIYGYGPFEEVPTHFVFNPLFGWTADDSYFVCFDSEDDLLPDMLIGRLPVKTTDQLSGIIDKIKSYEALNEDEISWAKTVTFLADKTDDNNFPAINNSLITYLPDDFTAQKLYFDNYLSIQALKDDIIDSINDGTLIFNYAGHGGVQAISTYKLFRNSSIASLFNNDRYPFMVMMTCANGYFVYPRYWESLAEELITAEDKGAIAILSSSGGTYSIRQIRLGRGLYKAIFEDDDYVLGSAVTQAKVYLYNQLGEEGKIVSKTFNLFGDPALRLKGYDAAQERIKAREEEAATQEEPAAFNIISVDDIIEVINNETTVELTDYDAAILESALAGQEVGESTYEYDEKEQITKPVLLNLMNKITRKVSKQENKPEIEKQEPLVEKGPEPSLLTPPREKIKVKPKTIEAEEIEPLEMAEMSEDIIEPKVEKQKEKELTQGAKSIWQKLKETILKVIMTIFQRIKTFFIR